MNVSAQLDDLRASLPGCSLVVFGDLFSQITLCVSARDKHPQEQLDALCVTAGNLLDGPAAQAAATALGVHDGNVLDQAVILSPSGLQVFQRSAVDDADVLACICSLNTDIEQATAQVRSTLSLIAQTQ